MQRNRWTQSKHSVYNVAYHLIWCPKYRRKVFVPPYDQILKDLLVEKAHRLGISIEKMEVMPDHVHLFVKSAPILAPHYIIQQLKGYSSRIMREKYPAIKSRIPTLWTRSYYCESIGHISEHTIKRYIEDQKNK